MFDWVLLCLSQLIRSVLGCSMVCSNTQHFHGLLSSVKYVATQIIMLNGYAQWRVQAGNCQPIRFVLASIAVQEHSRLWSPVRSSVKWTRWVQMQCVNSEKGCYLGSKSCVALNKPFRSCELSPVTIAENSFNHFVSLYTTRASLKDQSREWTACLTKPFIMFLCVRLEAFLQQ